MILNVTQPILDYDGEPARTSEGKAILLRSMIFQALDSMIPGQTMSVEDKETSFRLSCQVMVKEKVELTVEDAAFITRRSGEVNPPLPHGRICEAIAAASNPATQ